MGWGSSRSRTGFTGRDPYWRDRHQFLRDLPDGIRSLLPLELREFQVRARSGLSQVYYHDAATHFEAWFHWRTLRLELGLHFEKSARENEILFNAFDRRIVEIKCELGESIELERWEKGWARLYETWPCEKVDEPFRESMTRRFARIVGVLQPMLEQVRGEL